MLHTAVRVLGFAMLVASAGWSMQDTRTSAPSVNKDAIPAGIVLSRTKDGAWTLSRTTPEGVVIQYPLDSKASDHAPSDAWVIDELKLRALVDPRTPSMSDWDRETLRRYSKSTFPLMRPSGSTELQIPGLAGECAERIRKLEALVETQREMISELDSQLTACRKLAASTASTGR